MEKTKCIFAIVGAATPSKEDRNQLDVNFYRWNSYNLAEMHNVKSTGGRDDGQPIIAGYDIDFTDVDYIRGTAKVSVYRSTKNGRQLVQAARIRLNESQNIYIREASTVICFGVADMPVPRDENDIEAANGRIAEISRITGFNLSSPDYELSLDGEQ